MHGSEFWIPFFIGGLMAFCSVGLAGVLVYLKMAQPRKRVHTLHHEEA